MEQIKGFWAQAVAKAKENKEVLIKGSAIILGAIIGGVLATVVANQSEDESSDDDLLENMAGVESDDEEDE